MKFNLYPLRGVANLTFGMGREESRILMQSKFSTKPADKKDYYYDNSFQVFFDDEGKIEFFEISRDEKIEVIFRNIKLFKIPAGEWIYKISKYYRINENDKELGYSFIFPEIELSFWRSVIPEDKNEMDGKYFSTVGIGRKGYFSN